MTHFDSPVDPPFSPECVGDRIQHARRILGVFFGWDIGQHHLADFLGVPLSTVVGLEGDGVDAAPFLEPLRDALGVRPEYILFGSEPMADASRRVSRAQWRIVLEGTPPAVVAATR